MMVNDDRSKQVNICCKVEAVRYGHKDGRVHIFSFRACVLKIIARSPSILYGCSVKSFVKKNNDGFQKLVRKKSYV